MIGSIEKLKTCTTRKQTHNGHHNTHGTTPRASKFISPLYVFAQRFLLIYPGHKVAAIASILCPLLYFKVT